MPASPATSITEPKPSRLRASAASNAASSTFRPTNRGLETRPTTRTIIPPAALGRSRIRVSQLRRKIRQLPDGSEVAYA